MLTVTNPRELHRCSGTSDNRVDDTDSNQQVEKMVKIPKKCISTGDYLGELKKQDSFSNFSASDHILHAKLIQEDFGNLSNMVSQVDAQSRSVARKRHISFECYPNPSELGLLSDSEEDNFEDSIDPLDLLMAKLAVK